MKRNPPQNLLEDGITVACYGASSFLAYKYAYIPFKESMTVSDENIPEPMLWFFNGLTGLMFGLFPAYVGGYVLSETIKDRYL